MRIIIVMAIVVEKVGHVGLKYNGDSAEMQLLKTSEGVQEECRAALNHIYMCGYLTCPLCDDKLHGAHVCRSAKFQEPTAGWRLAVLPQFNFLPHLCPLLRRHNNHKLCHLLHAQKRRRLNHLYFYW